MAAKRRNFHNDLNDSSFEINMSDEDLEALMSQSQSPSAPAPGGEEPGTILDVSTLEPGTRLKGTVIEVRAGEVLVELSSKSHGVIEESEFEEQKLPRAGEEIHANFLRYDRRRGLAVLSVSEVQTELLWEKLRTGLVFDALVTGVNKGGLTLSIKGVEAFMPISQIERGRVEDASGYVGRKLRCEVTSFDRADKNIVVSRKAILEREAKELRDKILSEITEGEVRTGKITRLTRHGAFVDIGGVEGLIFQDRIEAYQRETGNDEPLYEAQQVQVQVVKVERDRGRIGLDFRRAGTGSPQADVEGYSQGDVVAGWVKEVTSEGVLLSVDEGVQAYIHNQELKDFPDPVRRGTVIRCKVNYVDKKQGKLLVKPLTQAGSD